MKRIKAALAALNQTPLQWQGNFDRILTAISRAKESSTQLLSLPEMSLCGYSCEDLFLSPHTYQQSEKYLEKLLPHTKDIAVCIGLPIHYEGRFYNAMAFVADGQLIAVHAKKHLAYEGIHYETRWFSAWPAGEVSQLDYAGTSVPFGDVTVALNGFGIGFEICEDAWVEKRATGALAQRHVDIIINGSASHFAFRKQDERRHIVQKGSEIFNCYYLYSNLLGNESGRIIYDGACFIAREGHILQESRRFSMRDTEMISGELTSVGRTENADAEVVIKSPYAEEIIEENILEQTTWLIHRPENLDVDQEFLLAETLGLWDYMRKSFSHGFILSLSGGVDSACCAALVYHMMQRAERELGLAGIKEKLKYFKRIQDCQTVEEMMPQVLLCVYQATRNSGPITENAAKALAHGIGAEYKFFNIDALLDGYHNLIEEAMGRNLSWETDDLALQNIQARVRAPGVWMLANLRGALLLTTSNRSEAAVGYATMDGDTSGGLCPLGGAAKTFLCDWLQKAEKEGFGGNAIPALKLVNDQEPTAELRPPGAGQNDEADLMPYKVLDRIQKLAILERKDPSAIFSAFRKEFTDYGENQIYAWIERFFRLWSRNQWKRERYAPSFHLDDENLDPRSWCRFPILSGGFEDELADLRQHLEDQ